MIRWPKRVRQALRTRHWREVLLAALSSWNRNQVGRIIAGVLLTWLVGGYCNGLARAQEAGQRGIDKPLCASCNGRVGEVGRSVLSWSLIGAVGGLLRPRR